MPRIVLRVSLLAVAVCVICTGAMLSIARGEQDTAGRFEFGLFGDMPYSDQGIEKLPNLIADMNAANLAFVAFDGDFKSGSWECSDSWFEQMRDQFNTVR